MGLREGSSRRSSSRRSRGFPVVESELGGSRSSWTSDRTVSTEGGLLDESLPVRHVKVDSCSQTDDELLDFMPALRRRLTKTDSSGSGRSRSPEERKSPSRKVKRHSVTERERSDTTRTATFDTSETEETDCLLYEDQTLDGTDMNLLQGSCEQSPLLAAKRDDDSTSEETLSETNEVNLEDLDELLSGVGPEEGSFPSVCGSDWHPGSHVTQAESQRPRKSPPERGHPTALPLTFKFDDERPRIRPLDAPLLSSSPLRLARSAPVLVDPALESQYALATPHTHVAVPNVIIQQASPCPSDQSSCSGRSVDSGRPSAESRDLTFNSQEDLTPSPGTHTSGYELTTTTHPRSRKPRPTAEKVDKFQAYLRTRGIDLDLTSVQSSDVWPPLPGFSFILKGTVKSLI